MALTCPKCAGFMVKQQADCRAPAHDNCLICGLYVEHELKLVMSKVPGVVAQVSKRGLPPERLALEREWRRRSRLKAVMKKRELYGLEGAGI